MDFAVERSRASWRRSQIDGFPHCRGCSRWNALLVMRSVNMPDPVLPVDTQASGRPLLRSAGCHACVSEAVADCSRYCRGLVPNQRWVARKRLLWSLKPNR
jgi:hypothetical protein